MEELSADGFGGCTPFDEQKNVEVEDIEDGESEGQPAQDPSTTMCF